MKKERVWLVVAVTLSYAVLAGCVSGPPPFNPVTLRDSSLTADNGSVVEMRWLEQEQLPAPPPRNTAFSLPRAYRTIAPGYRLVNRPTSMSMQARWRIEHLDPEGKVLASERLGKKGDAYEGFSDGGDRFYVLMARRSNRAKQNSLIVHEIVKEGLVPEPPREIAAVPYAGRYVFSSQFFIRIMDDRVYAMVIAPNFQDDTANLHAYIFDSEFSLLSEAVHPLDFEAHLVDMEDISLDPDGTFRMVAVVYNGSRRRYVNRQPNYEYRFLTLSDGMQDLKEVRLLLEEHTIRTLRFAYRPGGEVACVGFYSDRTSFWQDLVEGVTGAFYMRLDGSSGEVTFSDYYPFDEEFRSRLLTEGQLRREVDVSHVNIRGINFLDDDSVTILAEISNRWVAASSFSTVSTRDTYTSAGLYKVTTTTTYTTYTPIQENDSIIAMRLGAEGAPLWATTIPKAQFCRNDNTRHDDVGYLSFAHAFLGDRAFVVYNDDPENIGKALGDVTNPFRRRSNWRALASVDLALIGAIVDADGAVTQMVLHHPGSEEEQVLMIPEDSYQSGGDTLTISGDSPGSRVRGEIRIVPPDL